jgi:hypothetical protein
LRGNFPVGLPVPNDPWLTYLTLYGQGAEWAASANPYGVVFTRALAFRIE